MFAFGPTSSQRLETCHPNLIRVFRRALELQVVDITILVGHRAEAEQEQAFRDGKSEKRWPLSRHNSTPSEAVDAAPVFADGRRIPWDDQSTWMMFGGFILAVAAGEGVPLRWGGDWNGNWTSSDQRFHDRPHFELLPLPAR